MSKTKDYTVKKAGFINGAYEEQDATVNLTPNQARAFEQSGHLAPKAPKKATKPAQKPYAKGGNVDAQNPVERETAGGRN